MTCSGGKIDAGMDSLWTKREELAGFSTYTSPLYHSTDSEASSPKLRDNEEGSRDMNPQFKRRPFSYEDLKLLQSFPGEEIIGIITMEDVMEELLQVSSARTTAISIDNSRSVLISYLSRLIHLLCNLVLPDRRKSWMKLMSMCTFTTSKSPAFGCHPGVVTWLGHCWIYCDSSLIFLRFGSTFHLR